MSVEKTTDIVMWQERIITKLAFLNDDELFDIVDLLITCQSLVNGEDISDKEKDENSKFYQSPSGNYGYKFNRGRFVSKLISSPLINGDMIVIGETKLKVLNGDQKGKDTWSELLQLLKALRKVQLEPSHLNSPPEHDLAGAWAKISCEFISVAEDMQFGELRKLRRGAVAILITVNEAGQPMGIITESTLGNPAAKGKKASEIAIQPIIAFKENDLMAAIYERLCQNTYEKPIRQVVVTCEDGTLLGIVSTEHANRWKDGETPE